MKQSIQLHGKTVDIHITDSALKKIQQSDHPLVAEIHLIFGCMVAKRLWIKQQADDDCVQAIDKLSVKFCTVRYEKTCSFDDIDNGAEYSEFPLAVDKSSFIPYWVTIDFRSGGWYGTFGYERKLSKAVIASNDHTLKFQRA